MCLVKLIDFVLPQTESKAIDSYCYIQLPVQYVARVDYYDSCQSEKRESHQQILQSKAKDICGGKLP